MSQQTPSEFGRLIFRLVTQEILWTPTGNLTRNSAADLKWSVPNSPLNDQSIFKADQAKEFKDIYSLTSRFSQVSRWYFISNNLIIYSFCSLDLVETTLLLTYFPRMTRLCFVMLVFKSWKIRFKFQALEWPYTIWSPVVRTLVKPAVRNTW